jgi:uncharacterized membrane protein (UPF0136 family)
MPMGFWASAPELKSFKCFASPKVTSIGTLQRNAGFAFGYEVVGSHIFLHKFAEQGKRSRGKLVPAVVAVGGTISTDSAYQTTQPS